MPHSLDGQSLEPDELQVTSDDTLSPIHGVQARVASFVEVGVLQTASDATHTQATEE